MSLCSFTARVRALRRRSASERGMAVPTVMLAMVATFGLASATVISSVGAQHGSVRDQSSKAALGAADAGIANALLRFNRVPTTSASDACAPVGGTTVGQGGWCPQQISGTIDRGSYAYRVQLIPALGSVPAQLKIVSTGNVDPVSRRVAAQADTIAEGYQPFAGLASVIGLDGILLNAQSQIHADVATNGNIGLNSQSLLDCDYAQVGIGKGFNPNNNGTVTCPATQGTVSLPPVNPGDMFTNPDSESNERICSLDPIAGQSCASAWNPSQRRLILNSGASIHLGSAGGTFNYAFCQVILNANSYIHVVNGAKVRLYFGSPDGPPCTNQGSPLILNSGSRIQPTGSGATDLAILIVGSDTRATSAIVNADAHLFGCDQSFVLYAPRTTVTLNSKTSVCGGVAAKSITINANTSITASNTANDFELPGSQGPPHYGLPKDFVECTASPPAPPSPADTGC